MTESILNHKKLLIVDDEPDILVTLEEEILQSSPDSKIDKASNYEDAAALLKANDYDLVVLDIMGVRGFDLLEIAVTRKFKVAMLTAHALNPEALKKSHDMGAIAYLPKEKLGEVAPLLEEMLLNDYKTEWAQLMGKLDDYFKAQWGKDWRKREAIDW
ncbi:MAG: response regulator with CheY-like receiver, AAA-type ATPase, and DNA-binding domain [Deltaproteobacteria bacterium]|jgi:DNA-binding NtrC family response regulator|nr:response regulator with CheY-like receiver, AAA-type ATPase, and DNA-binding domain [Deltaproteobacteria bacterium]